jgi:hypothetical protein
VSYCPWYEFGAGKTLVKDRMLTHIFDTALWAREIIP